MYLPPELRLMIMEKVAHQKFPGWESCATINREWQDVIEKENYKKLKLEVSDLDELNVMVPRHKRHLVKHIFFEIDLPRDQSACCARWNPPPSNISKIVKEAIMKLFTTLSTWDKGSLTLELNVLSPSDSEHWFQPLYFSDDRTEGDGKMVTDLNHGWVNGKQVRYAPEEAVRRMFRPIKLDTSFEREPLPKVVCATKFLSKCVTSLVVFQDSRKFYKVFQQRQQNGGPTPPTINSVAIGDALGDTFARKSLGLKHLAVSFMVDAKDVLRHCKPAYTWPQLKTVALTSQLLKEDANLNPDSQGRIKDLLCRAAAIAKRMPELDTFVLWNGAKGDACAFIYRVKGSKASITWRGTWDLEMSPKVVETWNSVALTRSWREIEIYQERIGSEVNCVGDAIRHLKLPCRVVEPASLWQMRREGNLVPYGTK
ncbi:hypothetical protein CI102_15367 [Trichoderma harzianum]|uniref:DUF6546 domain-containing protein n=1 Tax=Trichoderma harzianum CBS 226.95 TaxID=983964 RepID=A0A2T4A3U0_TRIHA|nr:hypothetical protein M431DRAFT_522696 [Trichoderma harzianum CBS 226.95]PKK40878.1 hypothetical protein CI102_15367 [Trichoderma harzianum]PTB51730.1 hypothetical protein M431DRAFT_522696 [Trichoderma harzianum CBS 226.95]